MEQAKPLPELSAEEQRVLGSLIEKSRTTPDYYPMTLNGLTAACNQKSSRYPVVNYDEETVTLTLNQLKIKGLISTATGGSSRATKYKHNLAIVYPLLPSELAIICLLLLRGPLTPGEINSNSGRLYEFESIEEVLEQLQKLADDETSFVKQLVKKPGQKEARFIHLLGEFVENDANVVAEQQSVAVFQPNEALENRLVKLEQEVEELKELVNLLMNK
ncbi:YceH family protein [Pedobacter punctiformis]|uniref:YceH family protein n=1 Tax=Pedobacter punctiformis TaxID=3004097 RepID=A0ABT4L809_9SPHI|nr:YceH family protein [Pedobacter sp. HCMS5-2]MCZ4243827.1 YceH family protein [Pedobacter sp. HCMS5-2]